MIPQILEPIFLLVLGERLGLPSVVVGAIPPAGVNASATIVIVANAAGEFSKVETPILS